MTLGEYNTYRGRGISEGEDPNAEGYLVEYVGSPGKPNHSSHEFYVSWSPKEAFDESHKVIETYLDRLVVEESELSEKINKLFMAIGEGKIPTAAVPINKLQLEIMRSYCSVLKIKISQAK